MSPTVAAVIPAYRPDPDLLLPLVRDLVGRHLPVLVVDDGSPCTVDGPLRQASAIGARIGRHRRNAGIARSLNEGLSFAADLRARWLLTVDQDSTLEPGHVDRLLSAADHASRVLAPIEIGAVAAGVIEDASGPLGYPLRDERGIRTTEEVFQTGTLWAVSPLVALGGFDESLGIDAVDAAACLSLRSAGLRIVVEPELSIVHRVGDGRQVRILGRDVLASGHSPERRATIVRNRLRLFPGEFAESPRHAMRTLRRVAMQTGLALTIEDDRWAKAKASARGLLPQRNG